MSPFPFIFFFVLSFAVIRFCRVLFILLIFTQKINLVYIAFPLLFPILFISVFIFINYISSYFPLVYFVLNYFLFHSTLVSFVYPPLRQGLYLILSTCNSHKALLSDSHKKINMCKKNRNSAYQPQRAKNRIRGHKFRECPRYLFH